MEVTLSLESNALSPEEIAELTRELCNTLDEQPNLQATIPQTPAPPGSRADGVVLYHLIQLLVGPMGDVLKHAGGVVVGESVLVYLRPYFERVPSLTMKLRNQLGREFTLTSESVAPHRIQQTVKEINQSVGD